jgi:inorganic pyrophosphatase
VEWTWKAATRRTRPRWTPVRLALLALLGSLLLAAGLDAQHASPARVLPQAAAAKLTTSLTASRAHTRHTWRDTPPLHTDGQVNAYVEIGRGDRRKWEYVMAANGLSVDRIIDEAIGPYPVNYGFVPQTVSYDGDPFDVLVLGPRIQGGQIVRGVIVGLMQMDDEKGPDAKVVVSPAGPDGRPRYALTEDLQREIGDFFNRYKADDDPKTFSRVPGWGTAADGLAFVRTTHAFFRQCPGARGACRLGR